MLDRIQPLTRRKLLLAGGFLALIAALLLALVANGSGANAKASAPPAPSYSAMNNAGPTGLPVAKVGTPGTPTAGGAGPVFPASPSSAMLTHGPVVGSIRKLPVDVPTVSAWIAKSADGGVCVLASSHEAVAKGAHALGMGCAPAELASSGVYVELRSERSNTATIVGVAPDGVSTVELTLSTGADKTVPVSGDAWALESSAPVESTHDVVGG